MAYCRNFNDTNMVYLYPHINGTIVCCNCRLLRRKKFCKDWVPEVIFVQRSTAILHMEQHAAAGHKFPRHVLKRLREEYAKFGDTLEVAE